MVRQTHYSQIQENPKISILHVVNTIPTKFQSKRGQIQILLRGYLVLVEKFSSENFFGNGLKLKLAIVWIDPEQDSDLRDREVAYSRVGGLFCSVLTMITFDN